MPLCRQLQVCTAGRGDTHVSPGISHLAYASSLCPWMQAFEVALELHPKNAELASRLGKCLVMVHEYR